MIILEKLGALCWKKLPIFVQVFQILPFLIISMPLFYLYRNITFLITNITTINVKHTLKGQIIIILLLVNDSNDHKKVKCTY